MRNTSKTPTGFTFVESLIAFSIVGIFLALTWATVQFMIIKSNDQIVRTRGHFLAMEAIEVLRQIRQTAVNHNRETGFKDSLGDKEGVYQLEKVGEYFQLKTGGAEVIEFDEFPYQDYCRNVQIAGDEQLKKVRAQVWWGDANCKPPHEQKKISYSVYLGDLKK